jgi:hypothetical protein
LAFYLKFFSVFSYVVRAIPRKSQRRIKRERLHQISRQTCRCDRENKETGQELKRAIVCYSVARVLREGKTITFKRISSPQKVTALLYGTLSFDS